GPSDATRSRPSAASATGCAQTDTVSRLPIRVRLTLGFAAAMAVVLAAVGIFVYQRVANELLASVDQTLRAQAGEEIGTRHVDADTGSGTTFAQLFGPH